ncbi:MAG: Ham1 family [Thermomicrobiales bacterium]|jgi:inosine/xanthosine triphosphate pyrophosphatase family protein|nr:Ham1 family [Thermomicrobiales bacterium]
MQLTAATRNPAKVQELARLVAGLADVVPLPPDTYLNAAPDTTVPEESHSFEENAVAKAVFWSRRIGGGRVVIATDGGLLIPALGDRWNPARTRRFAGTATDDAGRAAALIAITRDLTDEQRRIAWQEALAVARDGDALASWFATSEPGLLARDVDSAMIAGGNGFWIPALWVCPDFEGRRLAELSAEELATRRDHWYRLGEHLRAFLRGLTPTSPSSR